MGRSSRKATSRLLLLLVALLLTTHIHCQEPADPDPDPGPTQQPPGGAGAGSVTPPTIKPPKEQGPDPAASQPPGTPGPPVVPSPLPVAVTPPGTPPQPNPAGAKPPGTPLVPPGASPVTPPTGPTPAAAAAPGSSPSPAAGVPGATIPPGGVPATPGVNPTPSTPVTPPGAAAAGGGGAGNPVVPPGVTPGAIPTTPPAAGVAPGVPPAVTPVGVVPTAGVGVVPPGGGVPGVLPTAAAAAGQPGAGNGSAQGDNNATAIAGLSPEENNAKLLGALLGALGAKTQRPPPERPNPIADYEAASGSSSSSASGAVTGTAPRRSSSSSSSRSRQRRRKATNSSSKGMPSTASLQGMAFQDLRSSRRLTEGLLTAADGSAFCVAGRDMFVEPASSSSSSSGSGGGKATFASTAELYDPACDDDAVDKAKYCSSQQQQQQQQLGGVRGGSARPSATFMDTGATAAAGNSSSSSSGGGGGVPGGVPVNLPVNVFLDVAPAGNASNTACTQAFTKMGSAPRSLAVVLIKWGRQYYKTKEECCREAGNSSADCDCRWNGYTYDNLPPPSAYSRMLIDECDSKPSINRAYYDMSGGMVTFHGKARVPTPASLSSELAARTGSLPESSPAPLNSMAGSLTEKSYLDPDGVDVFGWAVLNEMRGSGDGQCKDWCGDAIAQLGVNASDYNHIMCMALYSQSNTICDSCDASKQACAGTCPAGSGITTGCGCGTCSFAWGGQSSCSRPAGPGVRTGLSVPVATYDEQEAPLLPGMQPRAFVKINRGSKVYMSHELGHNMGLTHAGAVKCSASGPVITRQPSGCSPDWYGDQTSFMGSGPDLQLPNAMKYRVRWLPRGTLKEHITGTEQRYTLKAATSRRPSWQDSTTLRWFDPAQDTLAVRVPLVFPSPELASVGGYKCPCASTACPQCSAGGDVCKAVAAAGTACCLDDACADKGLSFLYIELHQPYRNDNNPTNKGVALRLMGDLSTCTSTRAVATHLDAEGKQRWLLDTPDPTGAAPGSRFEDALRRVTVVLEEWTRSQAVVRIIA